jgi:predicted PhzF superfamily epimerase YddE/YHI9
MHKALHRRVFYSVKEKGNWACVHPCTPTELQSPEQLLTWAKTHQHVTAFIADTGQQAEGPIYHIRWFSPTQEIQLCGHATLAAADIVLTHLHPAANQVTFHYAHDMLHVTQLKTQLYIMRINNIKLYPAPRPYELKRLLNVPLGRIMETQAEDGYYVIQLPNRAHVADFTLPAKQYSAFTKRALIVTSRDILSVNDIYFRYFAPQYGAPEDPATGSAAPVLAAFWHVQTSEVYTCRQLSAEGGIYQLYWDNDHTHIVTLVGE